MVLCPRAIVSAKRFEEACEKLNKQNSLFVGFITYWKTEAKHVAKKSPGANFLCRARRY
jgi:hypothetical protein